MLKKINHIALAVKDNSSFENFIKNIFNNKVKIIKDKSRNLNIQLFEINSSTILETLTPSSKEEITVNKFLNKSGEGFHHICFEVSDINELFRLLQKKGVKTVGKPSKGAEGRDVFFIHPSETGGILVEFINK